MIKKDSVKRINFESKCYKVNGEVETVVSANCIFRSITQTKNADKFAPHFYSIPTRFQSFVWSKLLILVSITLPNESLGTGLEFNETSSCEQKYLHDTVGRLRLHKFCLTIPRYSENVSARYLTIGGLWRNFLRNVNI